MEVLKSGLRYAAAAAVIVGICAPQPAMAARYEMVITCQNVWRPNNKPSGPNETVVALRKVLECTAKMVPGFGSDSETPGPAPDRVGPGIGPGGGPEIDCTNVHKERGRLQDRLDTLREELVEMNDLLANAADTHTTAQNAVRRLQADLAIEQASCNATSNTLDRLVNQAAAGRCPGGREEVREHCIDNLTRTMPSLVAAQRAATNACLFAEGVDQDLTAALRVERDAELTFRSLWNRRDDTYREMLRTQTRLQRMRDLEETCTGTVHD